MTDIWNDIKTVKMEMPIDIIKDYADSFNEKFVGRCEMTFYQRNKTLLESFSSSTPLDNINDIQSEIYLKLEAKALNNYQLSLLTVIYDISVVYPCSLNDNLSLKVIRCNDSADFRNNLVGFFKSEKFLNSASMILTQVDRAMQDQF